MNFSLLITLNKLFKMAEYTRWRCLSGKLDHFRRLLEDRKDNAYNTYSYLERSSSRNVKFDNIDKYDVAIKFASEYNLVSDDYPYNIFINGSFDEVKQNIITYTRFNKIVKQFGNEWFIAKNILVTRTDYDIIEKLCDDIELQNILKYDDFYGSDFWHHSIQEFENVLNIGSVDEIKNAFLYTSHSVPNTYNVPQQFIFKASGINIISYQHKSSIIFSKFNSIIKQFELFCL